MEKVQNLDESGGTEPGSPGDEFEPTAEMMVNDFDDEHTLDEEEAMEETEEQKNELSNLEKEKDMPLEALLAMYGYNDNENENEAASGGDASDEENAPEEPETPTEEAEDVENVVEIIKNDENDENDANVPLSRAPRLVDENASETTENTGDQSEATTERLDAVGTDENVSEEAIAGGNAEDLNSEQFEEEEEFVEEDSGGARPQSLLSELYKENPGSGVPNPRQLRCSRPQSEDEEEEDDGDYSPEEDDWKKTIMVGSDYQAQIPDGVRRYGDSLPYENEDKLLWDPGQTIDVDVVNYMVSIKTANENAAAGGDRIIIPQGSHVRDDEQALYLLLQCGHNYDEALRRNHSGVQSNSPNVGSMSTWSEEECRNFENGLKSFGKDFFMIQLHKVKTRSVGELVQFYYLWKKTERHDVFANKSKLEKKKYTLHPGTTFLEYRDFMEKFLDEQDNNGAGASSSLVHSLLSSDSKRRASPLPMMMQQAAAAAQAGEESSITADEVRILKNHVEDIARHLSPQEIESLVQLAVPTRVPNGMMPGGNGANMGSTGDGAVTPAISISRGLSTPDNKIHSLAQ